MALVDSVPLNQRVVDIDRSWWAWSGVHGGYLAALALSSMRDGLPNPGFLPRAHSLALLRPVVDRPLVLTATLERLGRTAAVVGVRARQAEHTVALGHATFGALDEGGPFYAGMPAPSVPLPERCATVALPRQLVPFAQHLEIRPAAEPLPLTGATTAELIAWLRFVDGRPIDALGATILLDVLPPALYATLRQPIPIPSAELAFHFADALAGSPGYDDWVLVRQRTETAAGGWCIDDSAIWTRDGELLAQARQSRRIQRPPHTAA